MGNILNGSTTENSKVWMFLYLSLFYTFTYITLKTRFKKSILKCIENNRKESKKNRPKRIILVRHGESQANIDRESIF